MFKNLDIDIANSSKINHCFKVESLSYSRYYIRELDKNDNNLPKVQSFFLCTNMNKFVNWLDRQNVHNEHTHKFTNYFNQDVKIEESNSCNLSKMETRIAQAT